MKNNPQCGTCLSSSLLSLLVSCPLVNKPGVSIIVTPFGNFILMKSNVVPKEERESAFKGKISGL